MAQRFIDHENRQYDTTGSFAIVVKPVDKTLVAHAVFDTVAEAHQEVADVDKNWGIPCFVREVRRGENRIDILDHVAGPNQPPRPVNPNSIRFSKKDRTLPLTKEKFHQTPTSVDAYLKYLQDRQSRTGESKPQLTEDGVPKQTNRSVHILRGSSNGVGSEMLIHVVDDCAVPRKTIFEDYTDEEQMKIRSHSIARSDLILDRRPVTIAKAFTLGDKEIMNKTVGAHLRGLLLKEWCPGLEHLFRHNPEGLNAAEQVCAIMDHVPPENRQLILQRMNQYFSIRPRGDLTPALREQANTKKFIQAFVAGTNPDLVLAEAVEGNAKVTLPLLKMAGKQTQSKLNDPATNLAWALIELISSVEDKHPGILQKEPNLINSFLPIFENIPKIKTLKLGNFAASFVGSFKARGIEAISAHSAIDDTVVLKRLSLFKEHLHWLTNRIAQESKRPLAKRNTTIINDHIYDTLIKNITGLSDPKPLGFNLNKNSSMEKFERWTRDNEHKLRIAEMEAILAQLKEPNQPFSDHVLKAYAPTHARPYKDGQLVFERIQNPRMCINEHKVMHHCVNTYIEAAKSGRCGLYRVYFKQKDLVALDNEAAKQSLALLTENVGEGKTFTNDTFFALLKLLPTTPVGPIKDVKPEDIELLNKLIECRDVDQTLMALQSLSGRTIDSIRPYTQAPQKKRNRWSDEDEPEAIQAVNENAVIQQPVVEDPLRVTLQNILSERERRAQPLIAEVKNAWRGTIEVRDGAIRQFYGEHNAQRKPFQHRLAKAALIDREIVGPARDSEEPANAENLDMDGDAQNPDMDDAIVVVRRGKKPKKEKPPLKPRKEPEGGIRFAIVPTDAILTTQRLGTGAIEKLQITPLGERQMPEGFVRGSVDWSKKPTKQEFEWRQMMKRIDIPGFILLESGFEQMPKHNRLAELLGTPKFAKLAEDISRTLEAKGTHKAYIRLIHPHTNTSVSTKVDLATFFQETNPTLKQIGHPSEWKAGEHRKVLAEIRQTSNRHERFAQELYLDNQEKRLTNAILQGEKLPLTIWSDLPPETKATWLKAAQQFPAIAEIALEKAIAMRFRHEPLDAETTQQVDFVKHWAAAFPQLDSCIQEQHQVEMAQKALDLNRTQTQEKELAHAV